jgi:hypothetical protein
LRIAGVSPISWASRYLAVRLLGRVLERMRRSVRCTAAVSWQVSTAPAGTPSSKSGSMLATMVRLPWVMMRPSSAVSECSTVSSGMNGATSAIGRPTAQLRRHLEELRHGGVERLHPASRSIASTPSVKWCRIVSSRWRFRRVLARAAQDRHRVVERLAYRVRGDDQHAGEAGLLRELGDHRGADDHLAAVRGHLLHAGLGFLERGVCGLAHVDP